MNNISKEYLLGLLQSGRRLDGRKLDEYRNIDIEYNVSKNAEGSARVKLGNTEVIVGVKLEVGEPYPDMPDEGTIIVNAELLPLSNPEFESGPPNSQSIELARVVDRGIRESKALDFKKLCIKAGEKIWMVLIDIYSINDEGNLQDAASLAAMAALLQAKMPKYDGEKVDYKEHSGKLPIARKTVECTVMKIGEHFIVDPVKEEEAFVDARLTVAVMDDDNVCAMQKGGEKALSIEDAEKMIEIAIEKTKELRKKL